MGTRHLTKVTYMGRNVIAQYGQWDGNPTGQGQTVGEFLSSRYYVNRLKENAERGEFAFLSKEDVSTLEDIVFCVSKGTPVGNALLAMYSESHLCRDCGAKVLISAAKWCSFEYGGAKFYTVDNSAFEQDLTFCEYVHWIDLDKDRYTIYVPRNGEPHKAVGWSFSEFTDKNEGEIAEMMQFADRVFKEAEE